MRTELVDGLWTLFYDGSELFNYELHTERFPIERRSHFAQQYWKERELWQQVIVLDGVSIIPRQTFHGCKNIKRVILANTVTRIEGWAFSKCILLDDVKWSMNLEYIGLNAFKCCALKHGFIPSHLLM